MDRLSTKFSDYDVLNLLRRIVASYEADAGRGLPIGALTSQNLANFYLGTADRLAVEHIDCIGYVRYMDDIVWWGRSKKSVHVILNAIREHLVQALNLTIKLPVKIGQSRFGISYCGFRIFPDQLLLSRRRKKRFCAMRREIETVYQKSELSPASLQQRF